MFPKCIRLVTFDATNTLLNFRLSPAEQYTIAASKYGNNTINIVDVARRFKEYYKAMSSEHPNFGKSSIGWEKWWTCIVTKTFESDFKEQETLNAISKGLIESYRTKENWLVCDGCIDLLNYLKEINVKIGVISNFDPRLIEILKDCKMYEYFDFILTSYEAECMKPNPEIFKRALSCCKMFNIEANEALHIGDDLENDYNGAINAGWNAYIVNKAKLKGINSLHLFTDILHLNEHFKQNNIFKS